MSTLKIIILLLSDDSKTVTQLEGRKEAQLNRHLDQDTQGPINKNVEGF